MAHTMATDTIGLRMAITYKKLHMFTKGWWQNFEIKCGRTSRDNEPVGLCLVFVRWPRIVLSKLMAAIKCCLWRL